MTELTKYRELERQLAEQLQALEEMKRSDSLKKELEFEEKLKGLMSSYDMQLWDIISILDPDASKFEQPPANNVRKTRAPRAVKRYVHPDSGEVIETKGGNHKLLKQWKAEHGSEAVEGWAQ
ncbi:histone-like nucleoid-structuring protein, MvaT/MvaU family [Pseudomonas sp. Marseille-QA0892]